MELGYQLAVYDTQTARFGHPPHAQITRSHVQSHLTFLRGPPIHHEHQTLPGATSLSPRQRAGVRGNPTSSKPHPPIHSCKFVPFRFICVYRCLSVVISGEGLMICPKFAMYHLSSVMGT